jgi:conjugal transfer pilus assembly protein TraD
MLLRPYEMPWRPAYEGLAGLTWMAAGFGTGVAAALHHLPLDLAWALGLGCLVMAVLWFVQVNQVLRQ